MRTFLFFLAVIAFFPGLVLISGGCPHGHRDPVRETSTLVQSVAVGIMQLSSPRILG